jgi:hypothetical protein
VQEKQLPTLSEEELVKEAEILAGRPVEVEKLRDGRFVVLWMCFDVPPPTPGSTREEALKNFIEKIRALPVLPAEAPEATI